ncbi:MAG TPA: GNAT family N-acetyltransferase [Trueperaceae bacterium]
MSNDVEPNLVIRPLTALDAAAYRELRLEALRLAPTAFGSSYEEESVRDSATVAARIDPTDTQRVFGALRAGRLVGTAGLKRQTGLKERHKAFVWGVYVTPDERGRGVAKRLMLAALTEARGMSGVERVTIAVNAANDPARRLYENLGFETFGVEPDALRVEGESIDEMWMTLLLR